MPLSEEELRLLDQMERALAAEDPKFVSTIRGTSVQRAARRRAYASGAVLVVGMGILLLGAVMSTSPDSGTNPVGIAVGVVGFAIMVGATYVGLTAWRSQYETPAQDDEQGSPGAEEAFGLNLIQGGKSARSGKSGKSGGKAPKRPRSRGAGSSGGSFFERMEQRWQRRRDNGDF
ncbi:DUF3040 domain-containing protein [Nocardioidaceae bacterium]|nr:DUF3040 domain-containing protein [Nocardioidaceae bacterium]